jgi:outer membrane protein assembly factor BamE (lipoprotein component of BamABCDE complex)
MVNARKWLMPIIAIAVLALTACSTAGSITTQPQTHAQGATRSAQDDTPQNPK